MQNCQGSVYTVIAITLERFSNLQTTTGRHSKVTNDAISKKNGKGKKTERELRIETEGNKHLTLFFSKPFQAFFQTIFSECMRRSIYLDLPYMEKKLSALWRKENRFTPVTVMEIFGPTRGENYKGSLFTIMTFQKVSLPFERPPH